MNYQLAAAVFCSGLFYLFYFFLLSWLWWVALLVGILSGFVLVYLGEFVLDDLV